MQKDTAPYDHKKRCEDYDQNGWCPKGTLCPNYHNPQIPVDLSQIRSQLEGITGAILYLCGQISQIKISVDVMRKQIKTQYNMFGGVRNDINLLKDQLNKQGVPILHYGDKLISKPHNFLSGPQGKQHVEVTTEVTVETRKESNNPPKVEGERTNPTQRTLA
jgi:hypothetical protein